MRLYCVRHGATPWTDEGRYTGISDPPLSAAGLAQADRTGARLAGLHFDLVVSSPLSRCVATWERLAPHVSFGQFRIDERAREIHYGAWEGRTRAEIMALQPDAFADWDEDPTRRSPPGGESALAAAKRLHELLADMLSSHARQALLVSHRTMLRMLVATALGMKLGEYRRRLDHAPAALTIIELRAPDDGKLITYNLTA
jgi:probable phosphoglycerate mutase